VILLAALALTLVQDVSATVRADAATVEVGQPVRLEIAVEHPTGVRVELLTAGVAEAWIFLEAGGTATIPGPGDTATTRVTWTVCALEPLEGALPALVASIDGGAPELIPVASAGIAVVGLLGPDEDLPRPPLGFRDLPVPAAGRPWWPWALAAFALVLLVAWLLARRARAQVPLELPPAPLERLAAIRAEALEEPEQVQAAYYEITSALRTGLDLRLGRAPAELAALTDDEWLAATAGELPEAEHELVADLLRGSAEVKYGSLRPTHWGVNETLERARTVLSEEGARPEEVRA